MDLAPMVEEPERILQSLEHASFQTSFQNSGTFWQAMQEETDTLATAFELEDEGPPSRPAHSSIFALVVAQSTSDPYGSSRLQKKDSRDRQERDTT